MRSSAPCFLCQIGSILFSLSCIRHSFQHSSLQQLAARLVADDCQRLRLCGERDIVNIVKGMQAQVRRHEALGAWRGGPHVEPRQWGGARTGHRDGDAVGWCEREAWGPSMQAQVRGEGVCGDRAQGQQMASMKS